MKCNFSTYFFIAYALILNGCVAQQDATGSDVSQGGLFLAEGEMICHDWRLPTKSELFELFYIHYWKNDGTCVMNHKGEFWMVSKNQEPSLGHWEDDLLCGPEFKFVESIKRNGFVRAIRP